MQLHPIRGKCCRKSEGKVTTAPLAKTFDTKDISLVNFLFEQCHTSSSNVSACGHSVMSPEDLGGLAAGVLLQEKNAVSNYKRPRVFNGSIS